MRGKHLVGTLGLIACVRGGSATSITPIDVGHAPGAGPANDVPSGPATCLIRDASSTLDLRVSAGEEILQLRIIDLPTESEIDRHGNALVRVRSDLELDGLVFLAKTTDATARSLHVTRDLTLLGGLVKLGKETEVLRPQRVDDTVNGSVIVGGYEIEDVPVPCDALAIDERATSWAQQLGSDDGDDGRELSWVGPHGDVLPLCSTPAGAPPCIRTTAMTFEELRRSGSAVEVRARFDDGSDIRGWAKAEDVTTADAPSRVGYGASGGCGCGRRMLAHLGVGKPDPRAHFGKAKLLAGSTIYAVPELKGAWAKAAKEIVIEIEMYGHGDHARVRDLPGVSTTVGCTCPGMDDHAFVKRESVVPIR